MKMTKYGLINVEDVCFIDCPKDLFDVSIYNLQLSD